MSYYCKKFISFFICVVLIVSNTSTVVHAADQPNGFISSNPSNGYYYLETEAPNIKMSDTGDYAMVVYVGNKEFFLPVGMIYINFADWTNVKTIIEDPRITSEVKEAVLMYYEDAKSQGLNELYGELFSPDLLSEQERNNSMLDGSSRGSSYNIINGVTMKTDTLIANGKDTGYKYVDQGTTTKSTVQNIISAAFAVAGLFNVTFAFISTGISLYQAFTSSYGNTWVSGSTSDYCQVAITYNSVRQWTYRMDGGEWRLGLTSQYVKIRTLSSRTYHYDNSTSTGNTKNTSRSSSIELETDHYSDPWLYAYNHYLSPVSESVRWKVGAVTFSF